MATTISRTWYNTLQDDSGGGTDGTIIDKADFDAILDAIDALLAGNLVFGGSLTIAGALAGATTGAFSSNVTIGGTLGVTGATTITSLSATKATVATGTITTSQPVLDGSQTWNAGAVTFTGLKFNVTDTASDAASLLQDLQVGGVSKFSVSKAGNVTIAGTLAVTGATTLTGALTAQASIAGAAHTQFLQNASTAASANGAQFRIGASGENNTGDVWFRFVSKDGGASETNWSVGADTSDSQAFVVSNATTLGSGVYLRIAKATGIVRMNYGAGTATFDASGNISSVSDARYKDRIAPLPYGLSEVLKLKPVQHGYNSQSGLERGHLYGGFLAQQVEKHIPLAVFRDRRGYRTLADRPILGAVVNAIHALHKRLAAIEGETA